ncbi:MAG: hypothetical protein ABEI98_01395 [Halorhabdus sp.]
MSGITPAPETNPLDRGTDTYEDVRVVVTPEGPFHYAVRVSRGDDNHAEHAVEYLAINATTVHVDESIWFAGADIEVGVPIGRVGETAWVWP